MSDLISRQETIDAILNLTNSKTIEELFEYIREHELAERWSGGVYDAIDVVIGLPSAQPEQRWIPCSERLPKYGQAVLAYDLANDEYEINFVLDEEKGEWFWYGVTAWMPLPEPYKEEGEQDG